MTTRLQLYNEALRLCRETSLASLSEDREPRRLLDEVWSDGGVRTCLEAGAWNFCSRIVQLTYDTAVTPAFGHNRAFSIPDDLVRVDGVWSDEYLNTPLLDYHRTKGYFYASIDQIYIRYVSNGSSYGTDLSIWPEKFARYVAAYFASQIVGKLTGNQEIIDYINGRNEKGGVLQTRLADAKNLDALEEPTKIPPRGGWARSRGEVGGRDRGSRSSLIG